jgi:hypothetical protein
MIWKKRSKGLKFLKTTKYGKTKKISKENGKNVKKIFF